MLKLLFFPFRLLFKLGTIILSITGKLLGMIIGLAIVILGLACCLSIIGFFIGIPLVIIGISIFVAALF